MLRLLTIAFGVVFLSFGNAEDKKEVPKELLPLQGKWKITKLIIGGEEIVDKNPESSYIDIAGDRAIPRRGDKPKERLVTLKLDASKKPMTIDFITAQEGTLLGIYKIEKEVLTVCYNESKGLVEKDRPTKFESPKDGKLVLMTLTKEK